MEVAPAVAVADNTAVIEVRAARAPATQVWWMSELECARRCSPRGRPSPSTRRTVCRLFLSLEEPDTISAARRLEPHQARGACQGPHR